VCDPVVLNYFDLKKSGVAAGFDGSELGQWPRTLGEKDSRSLSFVL
jgi:hypothetical protein